MNSIKSSFHLHIDAAHCHSPAGGQGMNLGLQDGAYMDGVTWNVLVILVY